MFCFIWDELSRARSLPDEPRETPIAAIADTLDAATVRAATKVARLTSHEISAPLLYRGMNRLARRPLTGAPTGNARSTGCDLTHTDDLDICLAFDHRPLGCVVGVLLVKVGLVDLETGDVQRLG